MENDKYIDGAHAACHVEVNTNMTERPTGYTLPSVQFWVRRENNFSGRKAALSDELTQEAMQWWATRPYGNGGFTDKKQARKELKSHLTTHAKKKYGVIGSIVFMLFINLMVSIVTRMIINWLFGNEQEQKAVHENRGIYFVETIDPKDEM